MFSFVQDIFIRKIRSLLMDKIDEIVKQFNNGDYNAVEKSLSFLLDQVGIDFSKYSRDFEVSEDLIIAVRSGETEKILKAIGEAFIHSSSYFGGNKVGATALPPRLVSIDSCYPIEYSCQVALKQIQMIKQDSLMLKAEVPVEVSENPQGIVEIITFGKMVVELLLWIRKKRNG